MTASLPPTQQVPGRDLLRRRVAATLALAATVAVCAVVVCFPALAPACPIHEHFGILCPGCGATHALTALLHGHLSEAVHLNALFVLLLPISLAGVLITYVRATRLPPFRWPQLPAPALYATLAATTAFTLARNLIR